jgi:hypothetical protein
LLSCQSIEQQKLQAKTCQTVEALKHQHIATSADALHAARDAH